MTTGMIRVDTSNALAYLDRVFESKEESVFKIMQHYAAEIMTYFVQSQAKAPKEVRGKFWTNHTFNMVRNYLIEAFRRNDDSEMGVVIWNKIWYAKFIEFGHGGEFASFPTILNKFAPMIYADLKILFEGRK